MHVIRKKMKSRLF